MNDHSPLHLKLYAEMVRRIRTGIWQQGDRVPSEKALIAEFGTSRGPVRQALAALRNDGMIVGGRGAPPRIHRTVPAQSFDTFMSFTEWANGLGFTPGQRVIEAEERPATEDVARDLKIVPDTPIIEIIRVRLLDEKPAMLERSIFPYELGCRILATDLNHGSLYQALHEVGSAPVHARHTIDAISAHPLEIEQLHVPQGTPMLRVRRLSFDEHGTVVETADDRYLPAMTNFAIENTAAVRVPLGR